MVLVRARSEAGLQPQLLGLSVIIGNDPTLARCAQHSPVWAGTLSHSSCPSCMLSTFTTPRARFTLVPGSGPHLGHASSEACLQPAHVSARGSPRWPVMLTEKKGPLCSASSGVAVIWVASRVLSTQAPARLCGQLSAATGKHLRLWSAARHAWGVPLPSVACTFCWHRLPRQPLGCSTA